MHLHCTVQMKTTPAYLCDKYAGIYGMHRAQAQKFKCKPTIVRYSTTLPIMPLLFGSNLLATGEGQLLA